MQNIASIILLVREKLLTVVKLITQNVILSKLVK